MLLRESKSVFMKRPVVKSTLALLAFVFLISCVEDMKPNDESEKNKLPSEILQWDGSMLFNHPDNPFLKEIPGNVTVHPHSQQMIELIKSKCGDNLSNTYVSTGDFSLPVYIADHTTPKKDIRITRYPPPGGRTVMKNVPVPMNAVAAKGSDGHLAVIDRGSRCVYEFWIFDKDRGGGTGSGNAIELNSNGIYQDGRSSVAAGWSQLQGAIWPKELQQGVINHALSFLVPVTNGDGYVYPATHNDGPLKGHPYAIPEGTLIRIRPNVNIDALPGLGPMEKIIYKAIQRYGMYCSDTNGAGLSLHAVAPESFPPNAYPASFNMDEKRYRNFYMKNFPFEHLEVIYTGELQPPKSKPYTDHGCAVWE
ncbi:MAG: hypothetical protein QM594_13520 [Niabella sp.]